MRIGKNFTHTVRASYIGYVTQAIVNNFAALLFLTFRSCYGITLGRVSLLISVNFGLQLLTDLFSAAFTDRIGCRTSIVAAHLLTAAGLAGLGLFPGWFADPFTGLVLAVSLYAVGGGLTEVLVSAIVEACPTTRKESAMSLLHSFYCWGQTLVVLVSTLYFALFGLENWRYLALFWSALPLANALYFAKVPLRQNGEKENAPPVKGLLSFRKFWIFALLMFCSGAAELAISQWASAFAESGLKISKAAGDLAGPCMFALLMGTSRILGSKIHGKQRMKKWMTRSAVLCTVGYLAVALFSQPVPALLGCALCGLSVGLMWPGTLSIAAAECGASGTALFALLALAGDLGCILGPAAVGMVSGARGDDLKTGLLAAVVFPVLLTLVLLAEKRKKETVDLLP